MVHLLIYFLSYVYDHQTSDHSDVLGAVDSYADRSDSTPSAKKEHITFRDFSLTHSAVYFQ